MNNDGIMAQVIPFQEILIWVGMMKGRSVGSCLSKLNIEKKKASQTF
jgi:hypothetical protein